MRRPGRQYPRPPRDRIEMTDVAGRVGDGVAGALSLSDLAVVAAGARPERLDMIDEAIVTPRCGLVAAFAVIRRDGMSIEERCRSRCSHAVVAAKTRRRRGIVTGVDVTRRARHASMRSGERKPGGIVIEVGRRGVLRKRRRGDQQEHHRNQRRHAQQHQTCRTHETSPIYPRPLSASGSAPEKTLRNETMLVVELLKSPFRRLGLRHRPTLRRQPGKAAPPTLMTFRVDRISIYLSRVGSAVEMCHPSRQVPQAHGALTT